MAEPVVVGQVMTRLIYSNFFTKLNLTQEMEKTRVIWQFQILTWGWLEKKIEVVN